MVKGVGIMAELVEYRNNIGIRLHVNAFGTCTGQGTAISDGKEIFVQDSTQLSKVRIVDDIDCDTIYTDSWKVLKKLSKCQ